MVEPTSLSPLTAVTLRDLLVPEEHRKKRIPAPPRGPDRLSSRHTNFSRSKDWSRFNDIYNGHFTEQSAWLIDAQMPLFRYLNAEDATELERAFPGLDRQFGETPYRPPATFFRRSRYGFGRDHRQVSATTHSTSNNPLSKNPFFLSHMAWEFLTIPDRRNLADASVLFESYSHLRRKATYLEIDSLRASRGKATKEDLLQPVCKVRSYKMAVTLLRFDFVYPRLIRWLGGQYTYEHRDFDAVWDIVEHCAQPHPVPKGYPKVDYERAWKIFTIGAPIESHFAAAFEDVWDRERYDNHPPLVSVLDKVRTKFNKEERLSYHILFPRSLWAFIPGLIINPMNFVQRPGDPAGRICVDPTSKVPTRQQFIEAEMMVKEPLEAFTGVDQDPPPRRRRRYRFRGRKRRRQDTAAPNSQTPDTGLPGKEDINPKVYYATAFKRLLTWIWRERMEHPDREIYLSYDDIATAFHRVLYHPQIAIVYAMVFMEFLIIPTGLIFGAKNSPSMYMIPGELRAHIAAVAKVFDQVMTELASRVEIRHYPDFCGASIPRAIPDNLHGPISEAGGDRHASFVDDTGMAGIAETIRYIINRSILGAYVIYGFPDESDSQPVINPEKFALLVTYLLTYLGFNINAREMTCAWPLEKRQKLADMLDALWLDPTSDLKITPSRASRPLGLIRHGAPVSMLGVYHSLRLQHRLNDVLSEVQKGRFGRAIRSKKQKSRAFKEWWQHFDLGRDEECVLELQLLRKTLTDPKYNYVWTRPIGMVVSRQWTVKTEGDACYEGLGGLCRQLKFMWRLSREDLKQMGFLVYEGDEPKPGEPGMHINLLEFLALIITLWLTLSLVKPGSQPVILATGDNTSALSWMYFASRTKKPIVRRFARFCQAMLTYYPYHFALQKAHMKGEDNDTGDVLSRFKRASSFQRAIEVTYPALNECQAYRVPSELLTALQSIASSERAAEWYVTKTTELWTIKPSTLPAGWRTSDSMTSLYLD